MKKPKACGGGRAEAARLAAEKRAVVEAQNKVADAAQSLHNAVRALAGADFYADELRSYGETWRRMKEARAELLSESRKPLTSHQLGKVERKLARRVSIWGKSNRAEEVLTAGLARRT